MLGIGLGKKRSITLCGLNVGEAEAAIDQRLRAFLEAELAKEIEEERRTKELYLAAKARKEVIEKKLREMEKGNST